MAEEETVIMTRGEFENRLATERVQTSLTVLIDDFITHKKDNKDEFALIGKALNRIEKDVHQTPEKMMKCKTNILTETDRRYVSRKELRAGFIVIGSLQTLFALLVLLKAGVL